MAEEQVKTKKSLFDSPLLRSKIHSANVKLFPETALGYLVGPLFALLSNAIFGGYLNRYYTDIMGLTSWAKTFATLLPLISVIAVIAGNLIVGRLMDKVRTPAGKARPLLLLSAPLIALAIVLLFLAPNDHSTLTLVWIAISYNLYYSFTYPFYYASHSALVSLSTRNSKHRGLLATASNAAGVGAVGLGCNIVFPLFQKYLFKTDSSNAVDAASSYNAWRIFMIGLVIVTFLGILIEYFFTRERITEETLKMQIVEKKIPMHKQVKACVSDKYWWFIIGFFFLYQLGGLLKNSSMVYYCRWMFLDDSLFQNIASAAKDNPTETAAGSLQSILAIVGGLPTGVGMLLAWPLANKFGKGRSMAVGCALSVFGGLVSIIAPHNFVIVTTGVVLKAVGSIPAMYVSLALLSDILDHLEAKNGFRSDGFTMSVYGAIMVGMTGIATGILNGLLGATGYDASLSSQNDQVATVLEWCYLIGELLCYGVITAMMFFCDVEKFSDLDHAAIIADQKAKVEKEGKAWIAPEERLRLEQEQADKEAEEARKAELKAHCEKKGLDYATEETKYEAAALVKKQEADKKKAAQEAKKAEKEKAAAAAAQKKEDDRKASLKAECGKNGKNYDEEEKRYEDDLAAKKKAKDDKEAAKKAKIQAEFDAIRAKTAAVREEA
jgi:GPH family glycoside/pentoside/hexuronide:cation symporter